MTLGELLQYLDEHTELDVLDGSPTQSVDKAKADTHKNTYVGEIIRAVMDKCGLQSGDDSLERVDFVNSLSQLRLKYMADDAPVEGFRTVERVIATADAAYNEETLREQGK